MQKKQTSVSWKARRLAIRSRDQRLGTEKCAGGVDISPSDPSSPNAPLLHDNRGHEQGGTGENVAAAGPAHGLVRVKKSCQQARSKSEAYLREEHAATGDEEALRGAVARGVKGRRDTKRPFSTARFPVIPCCSHCKQCPDVWQSTIGHTHSGDIQVERTKGSKDIGVSRSVQQFCVALSCVDRPPHETGNECRAKTAFGNV